MFLVTLAYLPSKASSRCPATILAESRIAKVKGRIILLIVSITTMKGTRKAGVPSGTKWLKNLPNFCLRLKIVNPSHTGRARLREKTKCLEGVKLYLARPNKFTPAIVKKTLKKNLTTCLKELPKITLSSFSTCCKLKDLK